MSRGMKLFMLSFVAFGFVSADAFAEMMPPIQQVGGFTPFMGQQMVTSRTSVRVSVNAYSRRAVNPVGVGVGVGGPMPYPGGPIPQGTHGPMMGGPGCPPPPCGGGVHVNVQGCGRMACGGGQGCGRGRSCGGARIRGCMRRCGGGGRGGGVRVSVRIGGGGRGRGCFGRGRRC